MNFVFKKFHDRFYLLEHRKIAMSENFYEFSDGYFDPSRIKVSESSMRSKRGRYAIKEVEIFATELQKRQINLYASTCIVNDDLIEISKKLKFKFSSKTFGS